MQEEIRGLRTPDVWMTHEVSRIERRMSRWRLVNGSSRSANRGATRAERVTTRRQVARLLHQFIRVCCIARCLGWFARFVPGSVVILLDADRHTEGGRGRGYDNRRGSARS